MRSILLQGLFIVVEFQEKQFELISIQDQATKKILGSARK